jgi:hypothetical protein
MFQLSSKVRAIKIKMKKMQKKEWRKWSRIMPENLMQNTILSISLPQRMKFLPEAPVKNLRIFRMMEMPS